MEKSSNSKVIISVLLTTIFFLVALCILFATGTIKLKDTTPNDNQNTTQNKANEENTDKTNIPTKVVEDINCQNSETTFNGITVKLEQESNDMMCNIKNLTINGKEIKEDISTWATSYAIYDNNVIILSGDTSGTLLTIYSLSSNSAIMKLQPETLEGYWVKSYSIDDNKIIIEGKECGEQCGNKKTEYPRATFEIEYTKNSFSSPKIVDKFTS